MKPLNEMKTMFKNLKNKEAMFSSAQMPKTTRNLLFLRPGHAAWIIILANIGIMIYQESIGKKSKEKYIFNKGDFLESSNKIQIKKNKEINHCEVVISTY